LGLEDARLDNESLLARSVVYSDWRAALFEGRFVTSKRRVKLMNSSYVRVGGVVAVVLCWAVVGVPIRGQDDTKNLQDCSKTAGPFPEKCADARSCDPPQLGKAPWDKPSCSGGSLRNPQTIQKCGPEGKGAQSDNCVILNEFVKCAEVGRCELERTMVNNQQVWSCGVKWWFNQPALTAEWGGPCNQQPIQEGGSGEGNGG